MNRIGRDELYIRMCDLIAERSTCKRAQVGCVITLDNKVISTGYNGPVKGEPHCNGGFEDDVRNKFNCNLMYSCKRAVHAEINAIDNATNCDSLLGAILYCSYSPCFKCAQEIVRNGIIKVVYKDSYKTDDFAGLAWLKIHNKEVVKYAQ